MTIIKALKSKFNYNLPDSFFESILIDAGLNGESEYTQEIGNSEAFQMAWANGLVALITTPNITEGDYSISLADRASIIKLINWIYGRWNIPQIVDQIPTVKRITWC